MVILDDLVESYGGLNDVARDWLRGHGVSDVAMLMYPGPLGVVRIQTHRDGLFEFDHDGIKVYVMPVLAAGRYSDVVDVLAFRPANSTTCWLYQGAASFLGNIEALNPDRPARIYPTPLDWLAAGGAGLVVLDQHGAAPLLRTLTDDDGPGVHFPIDAYDDACKLERLLMGPPRARPRIFIQESDKELQSV